MKVTIPTKDLKDALHRIAHLPGAHTGAPHTQAVTLEADLAGLTMKRFTSESSLSIIADTADVEQEGGPVILRHDSFSAIVSKFRAEKTTFTTDAKHIHFQSGKSVGRLSIFSNEVIGDPPEVELETDSIRMPLEDLREALKVVAPCVSKDSNRPNLTGVCVRMMMGKLCMIGSDGRRCHIVMMDYDMPVDAIISGEAVETMTRALNNEVGACTFGIGESTVRLLGSNVEIGLALINEKYPNIEPFIAASESSIQSKITINRDELVQALGTCSGVGEGEAKFVRFEAGNGRLKITANNMIDSELIEDIDCEVSSPIRVGVASVQFAAALSIMPATNGMVNVLIGEGAIFLKEGDRFAFVALSKVDKPKP